MTEDQFYEIWNRACAHVGNDGAQSLEGDVALTRMLLGHGYIMNGGLQHFEDLSEQEKQESIAGFRFFSFDQIADVILGVPKLSDNELDAAQNAYLEFDSAMVDKVRSYVEANPQQFRTS